MLEKYLTGSSTQRQYSLEVLLAGTDVSLVAVHGHVEQFTQVARSAGR